MRRWFSPQEVLAEAEVKQGLKMLLFDGICSQVMGVLTGGAFLVAFSLLLGASNTVIGLLAAIGPLAQTIQLPTILLIERTRLRKVFVVCGSGCSRLFLLAIALLPWVGPAHYRVPLLVILLVLYFLLGNISTCAFNSWMRDLIPEQVMGSYFAKRMAIATALGAGLSLFAGFGVDLYKRAFANPLGIYSLFFLVGAGAGLLGVFFLSQIPEPKMADERTRSLLGLLMEPFRDGNFRSLLFFLGSWNFAVNLAAPFFVVYMLRRLGLSMGIILSLSVLSQLTNVLFLRTWGGLADQFSNKSVLLVSGPLFILSILLWPFTTMPERYFLTLPLLIAIHVLSGMSTAGVALCTGNIALKLAPRGKATAYLATNALVSGLAATVAPILAGIGADWFSGQELMVTFRWVSTAMELKEVQVQAISIRGLDFLFLFAFLTGQYALHRLLAVQETGEIEEEIVVQTLFAQTRKAMRHVSNVAGMRLLTYFPYSRLRDVAARHPIQEPSLEGTS